MQRGCSSRDSSPEGDSRHLEHTSSTENLIKPNDASKYNKLTRHATQRQYHTRNTYQSEAPWNAGRGPSRQYVPPARRSNNVANPAIRNPHVTWRTLLGKSKRSRSIETEDGPHENWVPQPSNMSNGAVTFVIVAILSMFVAVALIVGVALFIKKHKKS